MWHTIFFWIGVSAVVYFVLSMVGRELDNWQRSRKEYPAMYSTDSMGKFGPTRPFWIEHGTDGQLIKNPEYTDDNTWLNEKGMALKWTLTTRHPDFGKTIIPKDADGL